MLWNSSRFVCVLLSSVCIWSCGSEEGLQPRSKLNHLTSAPALSPSGEMKLFQDPRFDSHYLVKEGQRSVATFFDLIKHRNDQLKYAGAKFELVIVDARDPRLYSGMYPIQPPTPATHAVLRVNRYTSAWVLSAWLLLGPDYLQLKYRNGGFAFGIAYGINRIAFRTGLAGLVASVSRNTSGAGWNYLYYVRGRGNLVSPQMYSVTVMSLLRNVVSQL